MIREQGYIMRDQARNQIPTIMNYKPGYRIQRSDSGLHLISVAIVTSVYLFAMTLSG